MTPDRFSPLPSQALSQAEETLQTLIRIPSISDAKGGGEGAVQRVMQSRFWQAGARVRKLGIPPGFFDHPLSYGPDRNYHDRPTIVAEMGPEAAPALLILAHSDTVALFESEKWTGDPFSGAKRADAIWGLGAGDDKWGLAAMATMADALAGCGATLQRKVIFASTIDEESGVGNGTLLLHLHGIKAEAALYLDGCGLDVCLGNLGGSVVSLIPTEAVSTEQLHSDHAALAAICQSESERRSALFAFPPFDRNPMRSASRLVFLRQNEKGGFLMLPFYTLPGEERDDAEKEITELVASALKDRLDHYSVVIRETWFEPAAIPVNHWLPVALGDALRDTTGKPPLITTNSKIDGFILTNHCEIPCVSFGPCPHQDGSGRGSYHEPDEHQPLPEFHAALQAVWQVIAKWALAPN